MRAWLWSSLSVVVALAAPRPADARLSLDQAADALCKGDYTFDPHQILSQAGGRSVAPLMKVLATPARAEGCEETDEAFPLVVDLLCEAQESMDGERVTPAFAPVRAALASGDPRRVSLALEILGAINGVVDHDGGLESSAPTTGPSPRCYGKNPILAAAAPPLAQLLLRTRGERRDEALQLITHLELAKMGAPFVPALIQLLDDRAERELAVVLLAKISSPAAAAAPRLGRLLAAATEPAAESAYATALATIGAPSRPAAIALPARLDETLTPICDSGPPRFPVLFRAARVVGPPPGIPRDCWSGGLVARGQAALARIAPPCAHPEIALEVILELAKLPPSAAQRDVLEAQLMNPKNSGDRRFWAAWALRSLAAQLAPASEAVAAEFFGPPDQPPPPLPDTGDTDPLGPLSKSALVAGMNAVRPKVVACYARFQVPGMAMVNVEIAPWGRVERATVTGKFAGTTTGACVEQAVKTARFPISNGFKTPYPFQLK